VEDWTRNVFDRGLAPARLGYRSISERSSGGTPTFTGRPKLANSAPSAGVVRHMPVASSFACRAPLPASMCFASSIWRSTACGFAFDQLGEQQKSDSS